MKALDMIDARSNTYMSTPLHNKPIKAIVCLITLAAFFVNICYCDIAWADPADQSITIKELNPRTFAIPQSLGTVRDAWAPDPSVFRHGKTSPIIIQIQDAHCNYSAQKKIFEIIEYINDNYGIDIVNLEGGAKGYDLSVFTSIADKDVRERTADYFVKDGLVNGAEYFAVNNPGKIALWGIEDPALYVDNLNVYRDFIPHKDEVETFLKSLSCVLTNLKIKIYSKELLEFDMKYSRYKADNMGFGEYLGYLLGAAKAKAIDIKPYHNIYLLNEAQQRESDIDFNKANNERDQLIDMLHKRLSKNAMEELVVKTVEFKAEKISQRDFYSYLIGKAKMSGIVIKDLPEFAKYMAYIALYDMIDKMKVMDEVGALEDKIKEACFENEDQRDLERLSKNLVIMKNIFNISLTRDDYRYYKANEDAFDLSNYKRFIDANAPKYNITAKLDGNIADIDRYRDEISKFYEYSFKRDKAFMKNIKYAAGDGPPKQASILVTGGFHTDNLCEAFRKEGISYISIIPNFRNDEDYKSPYLGLLAGKEGGIVGQVRTVLASASNMQIASMLSEVIAPEVWGKANVDAFMAAVYIQSLIEQGKSIQITRDGKPVGPVFGEGKGEVEKITIEELPKRIRVYATTSAITVSGASMSTPPETASVSSKPAVTSPSKLTRMSTRPGRLNHSIRAIEVLLSEFSGRTPVVYDIGIGWSGEEGPVAVAELADSSKGKAVIVGIDSQIPYYVLYASDFSIVLFDKNDNILSAQTRNRFQIAAEMKEDIKNKYMQEARKMRALADGKESGSYTDKETNMTIVFDPIRKYERENLSFAKADIFNLSADLNKTGTPKADIVRITNVLLPHYELKDIQKALLELLPLVNDGGYVLIGYSHLMGFPGREEYMVYKKGRGEFVLMDYMFSVKADEKLSYGALLPKEYSAIREIEAVLLDESKKRWPKINEYMKSVEAGLGPYGDGSAGYDQNTTLYAEDFALITRDVLQDHGITARTLGGMVSVKIEPPAEEMSDLKKQLMTAIKTKLLDAGVPQMVLQEPVVIQPSPAATRANETARMREELLKNFQDFKYGAREGDWVVKFDGPRIGATNDMYGREATDWFVDEILKKTVMDFASKNDIPAEIGGRGSEEFTFCFPSALSEDDIRIKMNSLIQSFKDKCSRCLVSTLNAKLDASQIGELKKAGAVFVYSVGVGENARTKIIFDQAVEYKIGDLLRLRGLAVEGVESLRIPYPVSAAVRLGANNNFEEASQVADKWQEQYKDTPIENGGELLIFGPPMMNTEKEKGEMKLIIGDQDRSKIEAVISDKVSSLNSTPYAVEQIYGVYDRSSLGRLLTDFHNMPLSQRPMGVHFIRGPPNEFYVIDVKKDGSFELVKFDTLFFAFDPKLAEQFSGILTGGRAYFDIKNDNRKMFGFKAINTVFGHDNGSFVIKALRHSFQKAFDEHGDVSLEDKTDLAADELNRIFKSSGFGCFIMVSHITESEAADSEGYKDFVDSAITRVDDLVRARDVWDHKATPGGNIVKRYSEYKHLESAIADNLEFVKYLKMKAGEDIVAGVDRGLAAKARSLHETVSGITSAASLRPISLSMNYAPGTYRTEIAVTEGTVSVSEYNKDGIVPESELRLSDGDHITIIARLGEGDILLKTSTRTTEAYPAGMYHTRVSVSEGAVSMKIYNPDGVLSGEEVFLCPGQNVSIIGRIEAPTTASPSYQQALAAKGTLKTITEPLAPEVVTVSAPAEAKALGESQVKAAKAVIADIGKGTADIIVMPGSEIYQGPQTGVSSRAARKLHDDYGQDTIPYSYKFSDKWKENLLADGGVLSKAISMLQDKIGRGDTTARAVIFVPFEKGEGAKAVKDFIEHTYPELIGSVSVVGEENIPENGMIDNVMHVVLGKGLLNYSRHSGDMTMDSKRLLVDLIKSLVSDPEAIDLARDPDIVNNILNGSVPLRIRPIDFKEISEWKKSQDAVLVSL